MIQTQSQNKKIRQIDYKAWHEVSNKAGSEARWKVRDEIWDSVIDKILLQERFKLF